MSSTGITDGPREPGSRWPTHAILRAKATHLAVATVLGLAGCAVTVEVAIHEMRIHASEQGSAVSNIVRDRWGNQRATQIEQILFAYDATFVSAAYWAEQVFEERAAPAPEAIATHPRDETAERPAAMSPRQLVLPDIAPLHANPLPDEGYWTTLGLPNPSPSDVVMAQAHVHPSAALPRATVHLLLFDKTRIALHMVGGTKSPGGDRGVVGPGAIAEGDVPRLVAAWNGGFQGTHAPDYGMYADGQQYRTCNVGLASIVAFRDGRIQIGQWGRDFDRITDEMLAVRQNSVLLVDGGKISPIINESAVFGLVNIGDTVHFITWRSAIGLTESGDLLVATGDYINQADMARSMQAAGAKYAMLLDNNLPYVQTVLAHHDPDGTLQLSNTRSFMSASPNRFLTGRYAYDFMYLTAAPTP